MTELQRKLADSVFAQHIVRQLRAVLRTSNTDHAAKEELAFLKRHRLIMKNVRTGWWDISVQGRRLLDDLDRQPRIHVHYSTD